VGELAGDEGGRDWTGLLNLYCWRMAGLIPYFKIGRAVRFRKADVDAALASMRFG